jgi:hypothetical protein
MGLDIKKFTEFMPEFVFELTTWLLRIHEAPKIQSWIFWNKLVEHFVGNEEIQNKLFEIIDKDTDNPYPISNFYQDCIRPKKLKI